MIEKKGLYKRIKIAGMLSSIPLILVGTIFAGYLLGNYLEQKFPQATFATLICIVAAILLSIAESVRIIRLVVKIEKKN